MSSLRSNDGTTSAKRTRLCRMAYTCAMHYIEEPSEMANTKEYILMRRSRDRAHCAGSRESNTANTVLTSESNTAPNPDALTRASGFALHVLGSGSKGNATIVETPDTALLIDCGISKKDFFARCEEVSFDPSRIQALLITHEHSDHVKGVGVLLRGLARLDVHPLLYTTQASHDASAELKNLDGVTDQRRFVAGEEYRIGSIQLQVFATSHDAAASVGFGMSWHSDTRQDTLGYVTDTGVLSNDAIRVLYERRLLAIESNHDPHMLQCGPYPSYLKRRVAGDHGHLSNSQAADALQALLSDRLEQVVAMHLSETNNLPELPSQCLSKTLVQHTHPARICVSHQGRPVTIR